MKVFNKNSFVFVFAMLFVIAGLWGNDFSVSSDSFENVKLNESESAFENITKNIEKVLSKRLNYHSQMMDINSIKDNLLGTKIVIDKKIVKTVDGNLVQQRPLYTADEIDKTVLKIAELQSVAENLGADFLYCAVPNKNYYEKMPENLYDGEKENYDEFIKQLSDKKIPYIDFVSIFKKDNIEGKDIYYCTDHHWRSKIGFVATKNICEELNKRYSFSYEEKLTDIDNYIVTTFPKLFLGSYGKKVGTYFTWKGADDLDLIRPNFDSDISYEDPPGYFIKQGSFEEVLVNKDYLKKDYYHVSNYSVYMPAKHHIRSFKNNLADNEKSKMLIVRTSYAQVVTPFLILQNKETYVCDVRCDQGYEGNKVNLKDCIETFKPNYVLVLYEGVYLSDFGDQRYDFFA